MSQENIIYKASKMSAIEKSVYIQQIELGMDWQLGVSQNEIALYEYLLQEKAKKVQRKKKKQHHR